MRHHYHRAVIQGADRIGEWLPCRSAGGGCAIIGERSGNALYQHALWSHAQVTKGTWRLTDRGRLMQQRARTWVLLGMVEP